MTDRPGDFRGEDVAELRASLGLAQAPFASLLGVHTFTVQRWESRAGDFAPISPLQFTLLLEIYRQAEALPSTEARLGWGATLRLATLTGGTLGGLRQLLAGPEGSGLRASGSGSLKPEARSPAQRTKARRAPTAGEKRRAKD